MPAPSHLFLLLIAACLTAGCARAPEGAYPSLAIREVERVAGTLAPPPPPAPPPAQPTPATLDRLGALTAQAQAAHARLLAAAPAARRTVGAGTGAMVGSEAWAQAQMALSGLETVRSEAMIALAELDRIYVDAAIASEDLSRIEAERDAVAAMVDEQNALIAALRAALR